MNLSPTVTRGLGSGKLFLRQHGPSIMTGAGVIGFAVTTALAIRQTAKATAKGGVLEDIKDDIEIAKLDPPEDSTLTDKQRQRHLVKVYIQSAGKLAKVYWPVVTVGSISAGLVIYSHGVMVKRNGTLVAMYTALDTAFKVYRKRVADVIGEDEENALYRRPPTKHLDADPDQGRLEPCEVWDPADWQHMPSVYAKFFNDSNPNWTATPEHNLFFLRMQQNWANDRLKAVGYLFLNEVLDSIGIPRMQAGQHVGWRLDAKQRGTGDGYVDFGIYDISDDSSQAFVNGMEHTLLLDFNVDGIITIPSTGERT